MRKTLTCREGSYERLSFSFKCSKARKSISSFIYGRWSQSSKNRLIPVNLFPTLEAVAVFSLVNRVI